MHIKSVRIQNFRSFEDTTIDLNKYTCLVGPNGSGKSTVLAALNVFFREFDHLPSAASQLTDEDFHRKRTDKPIVITVAFSDLSEQAQNDFSDYVRQGQLVVSSIARYDEATGRAEIRQYGERLGLRPFADFFEALKTGTKVVDLKAMYTRLKATYSDLPEPGTKDTMAASLQEYEAARKGECELLPSEDQFYGFSKGANRLAWHVQWVYVPAVKDPTSEQVEARNSALGKLLARTVRSRTNFDESVKELRGKMQEQYQALLDENQHVLDDISGSLEKRLSEWAHPDARLRVHWRQDPDKSVRVEEPTAHILAGEAEFEGELARFGHGLQRSYLLALLQELAAVGDEQAPTLLLACEEPELYQHPPQARYLSSVLQNLSSSNSQVVVSTHNPLFVSGEGFEDVRMIRRRAVGGPSQASYMSFEGIAKAIGEATGSGPSKPSAALAKVHQALQPQLNEMFFTDRLILVEGLEDVAYLQTYIGLLDRWEDYRRIGCNIIPASGKSELIRPLIVAKHMGIPTYLVFDSDADKPDKNGSCKKHERDNSALLQVVGSAEMSAMPTDTAWGNGFTMWSSDIASVVESEVGSKNWTSARAKADKTYGHAGALKKNALHIGASLAFAWEAGCRSASLEKVCAEVLNPSNSVVS